MPRARSRTIPPIPGVSKPRTPRPERVKSEAVDAWTRGTFVNWVNLEDPVYAHIYITKMQGADEKFSTAQLQRYVNLGYEYTDEGIQWHLRATREHVKKIKHEIHLKVLAQSRNVQPTKGPTDEERRENIAYKTVTHEAPVNLKAFYEREESSQTAIPGANPGDVVD